MSRTSGPSSTIEILSNIDATSSGSLLASRSLHPGAMQKLLGKVTAPALIVWGREDQWIPVGDAERFAAALGGAKVVVLDRCGHMPQEERPADVARLVRGFLAEAKAGEI